MHIEPFCTYTVVTSAKQEDMSFVSQKSRCVEDSHSVVILLSENGCY